jgi:hypothetical protein
MQAMRTKTWLMVTLVALSILVGAHEAVLYWFDVEPTEGIRSVWSFVFVVLLVLWVDADSKDYPQIYRPFEYGYLVLLFWIPYLPYYLWRTRRAAGLLMLGGWRFCTSWATCSSVPSILRADRNR